MSKLDDTIAANTAATTENTASVNELIGKIGSGGSGAGEPTQAQLDALAANTAAIAQNNANARAILDAGGAPGSLTITPAQISFVAGTAATEGVAVTGATGALSASNLPAGVTFDGANFVADGSQTAGTTSVTLSDASAPPLSGTVDIVVA